MNLLYLFFVKSRGTRSIKKSAMTDSENVMALMWEFNTYLTMCDQKRGLREMFVNVAQCCFGKKERKKKYDEMVD